MANILNLNNLAAATGLSKDNAAKWLPYFIKSTDEFNINTPLRLAHFIAQTGHESQGFTKLSEGLNYSESALLATYPSRITEAQAKAYGRNSAHKADQQKIANIIYANRNGNGNAASGDGYKYRGRGILQITGRANYRALGYESDPAVLELIPDAVRSAAEWWSNHNLNAVADKDDLRAITRTINGGYNGLDDRASRLAIAKKALVVL